MSTFAGEPLFRLMAPIATVTPGAPLADSLAEPLRIELSPQQLYRLLQLLYPASIQALTLILQEGRVHDAGAGHRGLHVERWGVDWLQQRGMSNWGARKAVKQLEELGIIVPVQPPNADSEKGNLVGSKWGVVGAGIDGIAIAVDPSLVWKSSRQKSAAREQSQPPFPPVDGSLLTPGQGPTSSLVVRMGGAQQSGNPPATVEPNNAETFSHGWGPPPRDLPRTVGLHHSGDNPSTSNSQSESSSTFTTPTEVSSLQVDAPQAVVEPPPHALVVEEFGAMFGQEETLEALNRRGPALKQCFDDLDAYHLWNLLGAPQGIPHPQEGWLTSLLFNLLWEPPVRTAPSVDALLQQWGVSLAKKRPSDPQLVAGFWLACTIMAGKSNVGKPASYLAGLIRKTLVEAPHPALLVLQAINPPLPQLSAEGDLVDLRESPSVDLFTPVRVPEVNASAPTVETVFDDELLAAFALFGDTEEDRLLASRNPRIRESLRAKYRRHIAGQLK